MSPRSVFRRATLRRFGLLSMLAVLMSASCGDGELFSPNRRAASTRLALRTYVGSTSASLQAADINRLRLTITVLPDGPVLPPVIMDVPPDAEGWDVPLEVPTNSRLSILVELINVTGGVETIEFSGTLPVIEVTSGPQPTPPAIQVFPGPPGNLSITGVDIPARDTLLFVGSQLPLTATVAGGTGTTRVSWTSSNPSVASVDGQGVVRALGAGQARITAEAGRFSDAINVTVAARATRIVIAPLNPTLTAFNVDVAFAAQVLDAQGNAVPNAQVAWTIADGTIATQVSPGVFRSRRDGTTTITATVTTGGVTITENTTLRVAQTAISFAIEPNAHLFEALNATQQFTFQARDGNGQPVATTVTWSSDDPGVATVDQNGLVTSRANGQTLIRATTGNNSATASVTVAQNASTIAITPVNVVLRSINARQQLTADVRDATGNPVARRVTWTSETPAIATVDTGGIVTARGDGFAIITATTNGARASVGVLVQRVRTRVVIDAQPFTINAGETRQLTAFGADSAGFQMPGPDTIQWSSANPQIASVSTTGLVTGVSGGQTEIIARAHGFEARLLVTVNAATVGGLGLVGDEDNFGYGVNAFVPCSFFNNSDAQIDLNIFDRELTNDGIDAWTHNVRPQLPEGAIAAEVLIEIREIFSDGQQSVLEVDGTPHTFVAIGNQSACGPPRIQSLRFTGDAASFANDGIVNLRFIENGDDIGLDWARVTVIPRGQVFDRPMSKTVVTNPQPLTQSELMMRRKTFIDPALATPARVQAPQNAGKVK